MVLGTLSLTVVSGLLVSGSTGLALPVWAAVNAMQHRMLAGLVLLLSFLVALLVWREGKAGKLEAVPWLKGLSLAMVIIVVTQAVLGMTLSRMPGEVLTWVRVAQAVLQHVAVTLALLMVLGTGRPWSESPIWVEDEFRPSLLTMAWWPAVLIAAQIVLGSAYRHGAIGVIPHLLGAMAVAAVLALVGILVATTYPAHRPLRQAAMRMVALLGIQVVLGTVALTYRAGMAEVAGAERNLVLFTVAHILLGSLTLAACVALALTIHKHVTGATTAHAASLQEPDAEGRTGARTI